MAPDPLGAVLPALGALGAISSIAAIMWVAQEPGTSGRRMLRKPAAALRDLERTCVELESIFRRLSRSLKMFGGERAVANAPFKFGLHGLKVAQSTYALYQDLMGDIADAMKSASQSSFDVMCAIEDGGIDAPEDIFYRFGECQERLNNLLMDRVSLNSSVEEGLDIATRLTALVRDLKRHRVG